MKTSRRDVLAAAAAAMSLPVARSAALPGATAKRPDGLHAHASGRGLTFGCSLTATDFRDTRLRDAIVRECGVLVPANEMKWPVTEAVRGRVNYAPSEMLVAFAAQNTLSVRGHTAIWHKMPDWAAAAIAGPDGGKVMEERIRGLLSHYRGRVAQWDVVNEAIEPLDRRPDFLRDSVLLRSLGPDFIARAFHAAREAAPDAKLFYNEYGLEYVSPAENERRKAVLELLGRLRKDGLVDGLGIQSHLKVGNNFQPKVFRKFLADVADFGVEIGLTELDVNDIRLPPDVSERDRQIADHATRYLDTALDERAVRGVVTWGLSTLYTSLNDPSSARPDKLRQRGLPFDDNMERTPLWAAIARAFDGAPDRR